MGDSRGTSLEGVEIRSAAARDLPALTAIYNDYVQRSIATFDEQPQSLEQRRQWLGAYSNDGPHRVLVAEAGGRVLGCAFSSPYRPHPAFRETVETSIYLDAGARGRGVGTRLYGALLGLLEAQRVHRAVAGIALPNAASVALHERLGFQQVGVFDEYALKHGRRISSVWMQKALDGAW